MLLPIIIVFFLTTAGVKGTAVHKREVYCIGSTEYHNNSKCVGSNHEWLKVVTNISKYFVSHGDVWFLPGIYDLDRKFPILNAVNMIHLLIAVMLSFTPVKYTNC